MADDIVTRLREAERSQKTICACCGERKPTPLRRSEMGGYVCLTCIDTRMDEIESLRARVAELEGDKARLDYLDSLNAALNAQVRIARKALEKIHGHCAAHEAYAVAEEALYEMLPHDKPSGIAGLLGWEGRRP